MKKSILFLCVIVLLLLPVTAFAADKGTLDDSIKNMHDSQPKQSDSIITGYPADAKDMQDYFVGSSSISTFGLSSVGPKKYSVKMADTGYDSTNHAYYYYAFIDYTAPQTGFYTFYSLTNEDTDIYLLDANINIIDSVTGTSSFGAYFYMQKGTKYVLYIRNYGNSTTVNYLMTTPSSIGKAAVSASPNGINNAWMQSFDFTVPKADNISIHVTPPSSGASYFYIIKEGTSYSNFEWTYLSDIYSEETDNTFISPDTNATYHLILFLGSSSKKAPYTVSVDVPQFDKITKGMISGVTYSRSLTTNDTYTTHNFIAYKAGYYKLACNRSDAKLSIKDENGTSIINNATANRTIYLNPNSEGTNYYLYYDTNGTAGTMKYVMTYLSPDSTLSNIVTSTGGLSPAFSSGTKEYSLLLDSATTSSITITPKPKAAGGVMKIDGAVASSKTYPVKASTNQRITIAYTSPDGKSTSTYYVNLRAKSKACSVVSASSPLSFDGYTLSANVGSDTASLPVSVEVSDSASWKLYADSACAEELTEKSMTLAGGLDRSYVKVTAEDGHSSAVYPVLAYRAASADPKILAFKTNRSEIGDGAMVSSSVVVKPMGTEALIPSVTKNGETVGWPGGDLFTADGEYAVSLTDGKGGSASFGFTIDKTAPAIAVRDSSNATVSKGGYTNKNVTATVSDAYLMSKTVKKGSAVIGWPSNDTFTSDGAYTVSAIDQAGNSATYTFVIDKTAPAISAVCGTKKLGSGVYVKANVAVAVSDTNLASKTVTKSGKSYGWPSKNTFVDAASYVITAKDKAGNTSTFKFAIDKTAPVLSAKTSDGKKLASGATTGKDVVLIISESNVGTLTATRNGAAYPWPSGNKFKQEGKFAVKVYDRSGNSATFSFNIDKPPALAVKTVTTNRTVANKGLINENVRLNLTESFLASKTIKKSGKTISWPSNGIITADGVYTISVTDKSKNKLSFTFTMDKKAPAVTATTKAKKKLSNNGATNEAYVTVSISDANKKYSKSVTKDGKGISYPSNGKFSSEGVYIVTAKDAAGNRTTFRFVIDRKAPVISCKTVTGSAMKNGAAVNKNVVISVADRAPVTKTLTLNGKKISWPSKNTATADGRYTVTAKDSLGYTASAFTFTIDKTAPSISAKNSSGATIGNNGVTNKNVTVKVSGYVGAITATKNGSGFKFPSGGVFTADGVYTVSAADAVGNRATIKFTIDKTGPVVTGLDEGNKAVPNGSAINKAVTVTVTGAVKKSATKDGTPISWPGDDTFSDEALYVVTAADALGNTTTYSFTIDKTTPSVSAKDSDNAAVNNNDTINKDVTVTVTGDNGSPKATKDGAAFTYPSGGVFTADGEYVVTAKDAAGNEATLTFTIDKTGPAISGLDEGNKAVTNGASVNENVTVTVSGADLASKSATQDGAPISWPGDNTFKDDAAYEITAVDTLGNTSTYSFTIDKTAPAVSAKDSLDNDVTDNGFTKNAVTVTVTGEDEKTATKDDADFEYPADGIFSADGVYVVTAKDDAGNETTLTFTIDAAAPVLTAVLTADGVTPVTDGVTVTDAAGVTLSLTEQNVQTITVKKGGADYRHYPLLEGEDESLLWDGKTPLALTEEGEYLITVSDKAGNSLEFSFTISFL